MTCSQNASSGCGPAAPPFPQSTANAPNLPALDYRIGDFLAFRDSLLRALPGEMELKNWRPSAEGDLALQLLEWQAYICDILTFYNERIANENYLRTAQLPESVNHLVQLLGYRPRPALGAKGVLAGLLSPGTRPPVQIPAALQVQSKPAPGQKPQVFEVDHPTQIGAPDRVIANVAPQDLRLVGADSNIWLAGKATGIKPGDRLLLITATALSHQTIDDFCWLKVTALAPAKDPLGNQVTSLSFSPIGQSVKADAQAPDYLLLRPRQSSPLWTYPNAPDSITQTSVELSGLARGIPAGALMLIDVADASGRRRRVDTPIKDLPTEIAVTPAARATATDRLADQATLRENMFSLSAPAQKAIAANMGAEMARSLRANLAETIIGEVIDTTISRPIRHFPPLPPTPVIATDYAESIWYANGAGSTAPDKDGVAIPHATIGFATLPDNVILPFASEVTIRWDWIPVGDLAPALTAQDYLYSPGAMLAVDPASAYGFPASSAPALLEDQAGLAGQGLLTPGAGNSATLGPLNPAAALASPIEILFNLVGVSRGKTVPSEVLGSGDPRIAGQDFTLAKSPVTYFADPASISGEGFSSTVQVGVNGVQWREVRSFYDQPPNAQIFLLREDDAGQTHVSFGDGVNGARLPTGAGNVVATYRYGAGGEAPAAETLTTVLTPTPGLKGLRNPLPPTGGAEADSPTRLRQLAPASVLTLGRVVSIDDFATVAATAGGVTQATASFAFDGLSQRPVATIWVAGDSGAVASATAVLAGAGAPMRSVRILPATPVTATLTVNYLRDPRYADSAVQAALLFALLDPDAGLLGAHALGIGQVVYDSQIAAACLAVTGVAAVQSIAFGAQGSRFVPEIFFRGHRPAARSLRHDPGVGNFFNLPNDPQHVSLVGVAAS